LKKFAGVTTLESTTERLEDALRRLATEARELFEELLANGAELPFEIEPTDDGPLPMYQYTPQTAAFIRSRAAELRRLEPYLEVRELAGEEVAIGFLVGLWEGRGEFGLIEDHLRGAIGGVLATLEEVGGSTAIGEVVVPLIGFHMPAEEIELDGVHVVRADTIDDLPLEALQLTRAGHTGKSGFVARVRCAGAASAPAAAVADDLRRALRAMRLFSHGSVGIASQGWVRRADAWERFGTGANRVRHGGYRLTGNEAAELESFAHTLASRQARIPALDWAISRFDLGAERSSLIEALSDYLLALRGLLDGGGPARSALSARAAALGAPGERQRTRRTLERALELERKLMNGARFSPAAEANPLETIAELEEVLRGLLRAILAGELGADLRAQADETLLTEGLSAGEITAPAGATGEWTIPDPAPDEIDVLRKEDDSEQATEEARGDESEQETTRIMVDHVELPSLMADERANAATRVRTDWTGATEPEPKRERRADWFSSADGEVEWPAFARPRRGDRAEREGERGEGAERVRYLFPVPDATDWDVGELRYEPKDRQAGH
jgi:hypothetical protein